MPEPVSTLALIEAGSAAIGAVAAVGGMAPSGDSGFHVAQARIQYPKEFPTTQFAHSGQVVGWDIVKFTANGMFWDNELTVAASGYLSNDSTPLVGRTPSAHPNIPVNRFVVLGFDKSGSSENMSSGLLNVNITPWAGDAQMAEGSPEDPWVALRVTGRFDPKGHGDIQYSFKLDINTHGTLHLSRVEYNGTAGDFDIVLQGDHVQVTLDQPLLG
ncbi:MAG: hypothetical protein ACRD29_07080 [Acidimicrobiales bacterium]